MSDLLARLARVMGIGHELASRIDAAEWHWARPWVAWVGFALLLPAAWWIHRRHAERHPWLAPRLRLLLDACRIGTLALLVFVLAGPFLRLDERIVQEPVVAVVADESESMDLPMGPLPTAGIEAVAERLGRAPPEGAGGAAALSEAIGRMSRGEFLAALEAAPGGVLGDTAGLEVRRYAVARRPRLAAAGGGAAAPADRGDTALGEAIAMAIDDASDRVLAGVVLLTDGRSTIGIDPLDAVRRAAEASGGQPRAPVISVPIGSPEAPADVAVAEVLAAPEAALGDTVAVSATILSGGLARRAVTVELLAGGSVVATADLVLRDGRQAVALEWQADAPGTTLLAVRVAPEPDEITPDNNLLETPVEVTSRRVRTLVVDAAPRWDLRFLDHALRRDSGFEATIVVAGAGGAAPLPADVEAWGRYDLVVLGDVPVALLPEASQAALVEAVEERGVGVVLQPGGEHLPRDYARTPLERLFPVEVDHRTGGGAGAVEAADFKPFRMRVTARGAMHPALAISGDATRNRAAWNAMPPFFRVAAARVASPAATVIAEVDRPAGMEGDGPVPLVAEAPAGRGRVAWIGTEETFRWRRNVGDALFWRFWGQLLRSVARRDDRPWDADWLVVTPARCEPGSPVFVEANLVDGAGKPMPAPAGTAQKVSVRGPDGADVALELRPGGRDGLWQGSFVPAAAGRFTLALPKRGGALSTDLVVAEPTRERALPGVDRETLRGLADLTGGTVVEPGDLEGLRAVLAARPMETRRLVEDEVWDTWPVLVALVGLYVVDVAVRRLSGLS